MDHPTTMTDDERFNMLVNMLDRENVVIVHTDHYSNSSSLRHALIEAHRFSFQGKSPTITIPIPYEEEFFTIPHSLIFKLWQHLDLPTGSDTRL
jgi:tRNA A37 threonylcarbamoyladenosine biosynthesis protein TsaE